MKRICFSPVVFFGLLLTVLCAFLFVLQPGFIIDISNKSYDAFMRSVAKAPKSGVIAIVDLDDTTLANPEYGQWPWPRYLVEDLARRILDAGAKVVAFDVIFAERDRTSPVVIEETIKRRFGLEVGLDSIPEKLMDFDRLFAGILDRERTILGCFMVYSNSPVQEADLPSDVSYYPRVLVKSKGGSSPDLLTQKFITAASSILMPVEVLAAKASTAFVNADPGPDGIVRSNPLVWAYGNRIYPSMALECVRMFKDPSGKILVQMSLVYGVESIKVGDSLIPTDESGKFVVNYREENDDIGVVGFVSTFPTYSAGELMAGKFNSDEFKGKIVLVGTSATGLKDIKATPLSQFFSGVEVHATIIDNIIAGDMLLRPNWLVGVNEISIFLMGMLLTVFISRGRSWFSFLFSVGLILFSVYMSMVILTLYQIVFVPVWIILTVIVIYPVLTMIKFWEEERQKKQVRDMFGTMVSQDVLHYLETHPGSFSLTGKRAEATMFFSDVAGFTTISESLEPSKLSELLNKYFSPMTHIIMDRRGYVDKFEGDAIMAAWGVPFPMKDHAVQACLAALEQQKKLTEIAPELKKEFGQDISVRMGLNSGVVTAGNMGSDVKFQYTVMGDAVNQAARFEPVNKDYGTKIIIGESTFAEAKDHIEVRLLDRLVVKGKSVPVSIYELIAAKGELDDTKKRVIEYHRRAMELHWKRDWQGALAELEKALELDRGDGPSANMRERVISYMANPPAEGWTGEYVRARKD